MPEAKPFASLGASLLARKGSARPAMRPQYASLGNLAAGAAADMQPELDDLGWNDMGDELPPPRDAEILALTPPPANPQAAAQARADDADARAELSIAPQEPEIRRQRRVAAKALEQAQPRRRPGKAAKLANAPAVRRSALEQGRRAAFTLRLDADRHLRLRLAAAAQNRSAQQLVTEVLDIFLADMADAGAVPALATRG